MAVILGYLYYERLIGISRTSFLAAILNCNFRLQTPDFRLQISEVPTELLHLQINMYLFVKWNRIQSASTHIDLSLRDASPRLKQH